MKLTRNEIIKELSYFYKNINYKSYTDDELANIFIKHVKDNLEDVKISTIYNENDIKNDILINTPDGIQQMGDLVIKSERNIHEIILNDGKKLKCSDDHLVETSEGWFYAKDIKHNSILTIDGFINCKSNNIINNDIVYDFEVLHDNHRYWAGDGISSHNTGKTYLLLNAVRNAIAMGYYVVFYDSENAVDKALMEKFGIDVSKVRYEPMSTLQEFRHHITKFIDMLIQKKRAGIKIPKIFFALDSAGNLPSQKEVEDAIEGNEKADMTRAKLTKSLFRIITVPLAEIKAPFVFTNHTYQTQSFISLTKAGGGCLVPGSKVIMEDNSLKSIEDIKKGDKVMTIEGPKEILDTWEFNKPVIEVEFEDGTILKCSEDHRFFTGGDYLNDSNWIKAKDLVGGEEVIKVIR